MATYTPAQVHARMAQRMAADHAAQDREDAVPPYYVSAGSRNVKLNQTSVVGTREQFGPFSANDKRRRLVIVFAVDLQSAMAILGHWRSRIITEKAS